MGLDPAHFQAMASRVATNRGVKRAEAAMDAVERESDLRDDILQYCRGKWPQWPVITARTDKRSTIGVGVHDVTVFMPEGRVLCLELKRKGGKLSTEQRGWALQMEQCGHTVHECRSMSEFLKIVNRQ